MDKVIRNRVANYFLDTKCMSHWLSLATNLLTLGTAAGVVSGFILVWYYLDDFGLGYEIMAVLGTPHYLLVAALIALAIAIWIAAFTVIIPSLLRSLVNAKYHRLYEAKIFTWVVYTCICLLVALYYSAIYFVFSNGWIQSLGLIVLFVVQGVLLYAMHGGPAKRNIEISGFKMAWINYFAVTFFMLALLFILLTYGLLLMSQLAVRVAGAETLGWWVLGLGYFIYCMSVTSTVYQRESWVGYLPVGVLTIVFLSAFFSNAAYNIVSLIRIGKCLA